MGNSMHEQIADLAARLEIDVSTLNQTQMIALKRVIEIKGATKRMQSKIAAGHHRSDDYRARLQQYDVSLAALELELKTGKPHKISGAPTAGGVTINVPAGALKMEALG